MSTYFTNRFAVSPSEAEAMSASQLRQNFLLEDLFVPGRINLNYSNYDRLIIGGATPAQTPLMLETIKPCGTANFLDRRELIAINIGGAGTITVNGTAHPVGPHDMLYIGKDSTSVSFGSDAAEEPAKFYLVSAPAHAKLPTRLIRIDDAKRVDLGSPMTSNERSIFQFIHPEGAKTCQLVVGMTKLAKGSVWNTIPAHLHDRRSEAYLYFDLPASERVLHLMGRPTETRHLFIANEQAVLSPNWSLHSGAGTSSYSFIWAMAGDNVDYTDVDPVVLGEMR